MYFSCLSLVEEGTYEHSIMLKLENIVKNKILYWSSTIQKKREKENDVFKTIYYDSFSKLTTELCCR